MLQGILTALVVTIGWVLIQVGIMHLRPESNRLKAMTVGYLLSLPAVYVVYRWIPLAQDAGEPNRVMGLIHGYVLHLLLYLFYVECFYHIERSVTLRLLIEIMENREGGQTLDDLQSQYSVDDMIRTRLGVLRERNFIQDADGRWQLKPKGKLFVSVMRLSCWIFQSTPQRDRL